MISVLLLLAVLAGGSISVYGQSMITSVLQRNPVLTPSLTTYPDSSLFDRSAQLDAPAGKHGFVTTRNGHFYFADGKRARFYGINIAKDSLFITKPEIDRIVDLFARSGINLVRIHHIDDIKGIIDPQNPDAFRADKLDLIDYWIARLKARGIYLCLDLNDYRTFREAEGVTNGEKLGRGAKPYAVFNERLFKLQLDYARRFLSEHVNPYTQLSYAKDPAIALLEIYDENGLFIRYADWQRLVDPYNTELQQQWNSWLRYRYGTTAALKVAWTNRGGGCALTAQESLEQATVKLPVMELLFNPPMGVTRPLQAPARVSDGALFAYETQLNYLMMMKSGLRELGVKIPITAVGGQNIIPDIKNIAEACDYIGINFYWDHPSWIDGRDWIQPFYFSYNHPIVDNAAYSFPAWVSLSRVHNRPMVVRELGYCFPNPYRGVGMIESAAYGAFLDLDALILFTFDAHSDNPTIGYFDIHLDPLRWGLVAQASRLFLSGEVKEAGTKVGVGYSEVDAFTWRSYASSLYQLAYASRIENYFDEAKAHPFDLLVSSGRSCGSKWLGDRLLLFANQRHSDLHYQGIADGLELRHGYRLQSTTAGPASFVFNGIGYDVGGVKTLTASPPFLLSDLKAKNLLPIGVSPNSALGFLDTKRKVVGFRNAPEELVMRVGLDVLRDWSNARLTHGQVDQRIWRTDTGQLVRDLPSRVLRVDTPRFQALAGNLGASTSLRTGAMRLSTPSQIGTLTVESLDARPLAESEKYLIKMTTRAHNDQQSSVRVNDGPKEYKLLNTGVPPVSTDGQQSTIPTRIELNGKLVLEMDLRDGTWEYLVEANHALLYLDTPNITVRLPEKPKTICLHQADKTVLVQPSDNTFTYAEGTRYAEIFWE